MVDSAKFSTFINFGDIVSGDTVVGLRDGVNARFTFSSGLVDTISGTANQIDVDNTTPSDPVLSLSSTLDMPGTLTIQSSIAIDSIIDDDTFATATATNIPTAESVKAYVDAGDAGLVDSVTGTTNEVDVDNTDPANPIVGLSSTVIFPGTAAFNDGNGILTGNGNNALLFNQTATAVNYLEITPAATANGPLLQAVGTDANVDFLIQAQGTGDILFNGSNVICGDLGTEAAGIDIGGVTYDASLKVSDLGGSQSAQLILHRHSTTLEPLIVGARSNSDTSSETAVTAGQTCMATYGSGWTGAEYNLFGAIEIMVDGTGTISDASSPGQIQFNVTADAATVPSTAVTISNNKTVTFSGDLNAGMTNGQLLIGDTGNVLTKSTLTAGTGISITNAAGSITIDSSASGMGWSTDATGTIAADVDNGYICGAAGATTITLPATAAIGSVVVVEGLGAGGWVLTASAGDTIQIGTSATSSGGTLTSAAATDNVTVICIVADTTWRVQSTNSAGLTIA